jgi:hypothetical protein
MWSTHIDVECCCKNWSQYKKASLNPSDPHWVLSGSLAFSPKNLPSLRRALLNKVFPTKKDYQATLTQGLRVWTKRKGLPSRPNNHISDLVHHLWQQHTNHLTHHITKSTFDGAIFHWEDKHASSLRIFYPCLYFKATETTFMNTSIFETVSQDPQTLVTSLVSSLQTSYGRSYPWAIGNRTSTPIRIYILAKKKKAYQSGRPIISFVDSPFRPMLNIPGRIIFHLFHWPAPAILHREMFIQTPKDPPRSSSQWRSQPVQPGLGRFLH